jgi:hypothetical protein
MVCLELNWVKPEKGVVKRAKLQIIWTRLTSEHNIRLIEDYLTIQGSRNSHTEAQDHIFGV